MKFGETATCRSGQQCSICRHKQQGYFWRRMIARVYEVEGLDFPCPQGKPWIDSKVPAVQSAKIVLAPFDTKLIGDYRYMAGRIRDNESKLRTQLPPDAPVSIALMDMLKAEQAGGCQGCKRKRWLRTVYQAYDKSTDEQKKVIVAVLST